jgi:hypothetical protein
MFAGAPRPEPDPDLTAPTPGAFGAAIAEGRLASGSPEMMYTLGKMSLARFLAGVSAPDFGQALAIVRHGR